MKNRKLLISLFFIIVILAAAFITLSPKITPPPTNQVQIPQGWNTITSNENGYEVNFPANLTPERPNKRSLLILDLKKQGPVGNTNFIYISYIPSLENNQPGDIYNFDAKQFDLLLKTDVGKSVDLSKGMQTEWFTYTRTADTKISGYDAMHFMNKKPWEFPKGTIENRYIVKTNHGYYLIGEYAQNENNSPSQTFEEIIKTFKITPANDTPPLETSEITIPKNFQTVTDEAIGITVLYPPNWKYTPAPKEGYGGVIRLQGDTPSEKNVWIEIGRHVSPPLAKGKSLREYEMERSPETQPVEERRFILNGREYYQQLIEMRAGGAGSKTYGVYTIFAMNDEVYFSELYTNQPFDHFELINQILSSIKQK